MASAFATNCANGASARSFPFAFALQNANEVCPRSSQPVREAPLGDVSGNDVAPESSAHRWWHGARRRARRLRRTARAPLEDADRLARGSERKHPSTCDGPRPRGR